MDLVCAIRQAQLEWGMVINYRYLDAMIYRLFILLTFSCFIACSDQGDEPMMEDLPYPVSEEIQDIWSEIQKVEYSNVRDLIVLANKLTDISDDPAAHLLGEYYLIKAEFLRTASLISGIRLAEIYEEIKKYNWYHIMADIDIHLIIFFYDKDNKLEASQRISNCMDYCFRRELVLERYTLQYALSPLVFSSESAIRKDEIQKYIDALPKDQWNFFISRIFMGLAQAYYRLGDKEEAIRLLKKGVERNEKEGLLFEVIHYYDALGDFTRRGNYQLGIEYYKKAVAVSESYGTTNLDQFYRMIGHLYFNHKMYGKALDQYDKARKYSQMNGDSLLVSMDLGYYGWAYFKLDPQKNFEVANQYYEEAISFTNESTVAYRQALERRIWSLRLIGRNDEADRYELYKLKKSLDAVSESNNSKYLEIMMNAQMRMQSRDEKILLLEAENELNIERLKRRRFQSSFAFVLALLAISGFFVIYQNNERSKELAQKNRLLVEKEIEFRSFRDNLYANLSHEFRTPLTIFKANLDSIRKGRIEDKNVIEKKANMMYRNVDALTDLTNQMLDLARISENKINVQLQSLDISRYIEEVLSILSSMADNKIIELQLIEPKEAVIFEFDKIIIWKAIYNLVQNAIKFSNDGDKVVILIKVMEMKCQIQVSDTGRGIRQEDLPFIFDRYFKSPLESNNKETGGLGLALTKQFIEIAGGAIEVVSQVGKGTTFTITLPMHKSLDPSIYQETKSTMFTSGSNDRFFSDKTIDEEEFDPGGLLKDYQDDKKHILVVEDHKDLNKLLADTLGEHYRVSRAYNGEEALAKIQSNIPDLIISDVMMPKMNGVQLIHEISNNEYYNHIPIIVMSALDSNIEEHQLWKEGIVDFVKKPFDMDILQYKIKNFFDLLGVFHERIKESGLSGMMPESPVTSRDKVFLEKLILYIESNLDNDHFSVEALSRKMHISRAGLYQKVKSLTGYPPSIFLKKYRLNRAKQMIESGSGNISEIANNVGYSNLSQFSRSFKEEFGKSPSKI